MKLLVFAPLCFAVPVISNQDGLSSEHIDPYCQFNSDESEDFCDGVINGILAEIEEQNRKLQRKEQERRELEMRELEMREHQRKEQERRELEMRQRREQQQHNSVSIASQVINNYHIKKPHAKDAPPDDFYEMLRRIPFS